MEDMGLKKFFDCDFLLSTKTPVSDYQGLCPVGKIPSCQLLKCGKTKIFNDWS